MTPDLAARLAATAAESLAREFPHAPAHVVTGPDDRALPRELHPAFWGSYDWHSSVHMTWSLAHLVLRHGAPGRERLDAQLTAPALRSEADYLRAWPGFERPYGWAWLMLLAAECRDEPAWSRALETCVDALRELLLAWLARARPVRTGTHADSAFSLGLVLEACGPLGLDDVAATVRDRALRWYGSDRDAPARWEPGGEDFSSPSLSEADLLRRVLPAPDLATWLTGFLPGLAGGEPATLLTPAEAVDRSDGRTGHLDGLALSRAAALRALAAALPAGDPRRPVLDSAADRHLAAGLAALDVGEFGSTHWLTSFALRALEGGGCSA